MGKLYLYLAMCSFVVVMRDLFHIIFYYQRSKDVIRPSGFAIPSFDEPLSMQSMRDLLDFS